VTIKLTPELISLVIGTVTAIVMPLTLLIVRSAVKWAKLESRVEEVIADVKELIGQKDKFHAALVDQMKSDREATDRRLRWLEEHLWRRDKNSAV